MLGNPGTYANKKRKKPVLKQKKISDGNEVVKSNPSKRHRDRLNGELDRLMDLLPFSEEVRSRLDKLSVLRLSVGYLRVKSHFRATIKGGGGLAVPGVNGQSRSSVEAAPLSEGELLMQALNGFVMVVTSDGLVFYSSPTIKDYLGFHQSDVIHQSVFDLIHTDDRSMFREQLHFALNPPPLAGDGDGPQGGGGAAVTYRPEQLPPENSSFLERSFVCRFRCLLDNSSGFLALKFQGRLRYLHGQSAAGGGRPQLALFAMAVPVQQPSIVEIRAKMLLFQSKHGLDFTPMGIDSRGKIILGYSEVELCMKGSGYQFIHAADMMYCADNHIRMIKTGESGLTVFRLLTKSGSWVWVKSNAKLIFKGGRPDFIIAYQRALTNPEGEAYLRQRRLQLPFSFTTGEGVLYNTTPSVDPAQLQFHKRFQDGASEKKLTPTSLLDCFLSQDEAVYSQTAEAPLPVDQVFMESRALLSVASNSWQDGADGAAAAVKEEAEPSVTALIDSLEKMADGGDLGAVLQDLDVDDAALLELEAALNAMSQGAEPPGAVTSDLGGLLASDMFDYIDSVLFKDKAEDFLGAVSPGCLSAGPPPFPQACQPLLLHTANGGSPNGLYPQPRAATGGGVAEPAPVFTQKLSHQGPPVAPPTVGLPPIQQLQLQDIFSPSIELPQLTVPPPDAPPRLQPHGAPALYPGGPPPPPHADVLPPLIPSKDSSSPHIPVRLSVSCGQESLQAWPQGPPGPPGPLQNRHDNMLSFQHSDGRAFLPGGVPGPDLVQQQRGGPAGAQPAALSSCMFSGPAPGGVTAPPGSAGLQGGTTYQDQSPPQGACYYQWGHNEPVVGTAVISQEDASVSPLSAPPSSRPLQNGGIPPEHNGYFLRPAHDVAAYMME